MRNVVTLPYDPIWKALDWAKEHCPSYITNDAAHPGGNKPGGDYFSPSVINYYFGSEKDAVIFALNWL